MARWRFIRFIWANPCAGRLATTSCCFFFMHFFSCRVSNILDFTCWQVDKRSAHFYSVDITEEEAKLGLVCRVRSTSKSKFKVSCKLVATICLSCSFDNLTTPLHFLWPRNFIFSYL